jgi:eukaryotic-like serine/threonine-protein kinase
LSVMAPGAAFGSYTLLSRLAKGGMGEIWLAEQKGLSGFSKRVVIKTILECFEDDPTLVEMFLEEGRVAAGLIHPNIAQTYDLGQFENTYYIAMEYVQGRDLRHLLLANIDRKQFIPLNLVLRTMAEVCQGLFYAHTWKTPEGIAAGIIHRDISPQNILVTFDGVVKIIDFGIAKAMAGASKTRSGVLKGKYAYMSPEQIQGQSLDARSDLFSLGVVMYELLTSRRLFKRESEFDTMEAVLETKIPPLNRIDQSIPKELESVLHKALTKSREKRYANAREMQLFIEDAMLKTQLMASSAHLSGYMQLLFDEKEPREQKTVGLLQQRMAQLPGVLEEATPLERTMSFVPAGVLPPSSDGTAQTQSVLGPRKQKSNAKEARKNLLRWMTSAGVVLLLLLGAALWKMQIPKGEEGGGKFDGQAALVAEDAGVVIPPGFQDGGAFSGDPDSGFESEDDLEPKGKDDELVVDLQKDPLEAQGDRLIQPPGKNRSYLTVSTVPPADLFLDGHPVGFGTIRKTSVAPGRHTLKAVVKEGGSKLVPVVLAAGAHMTKNIVLGRGTLNVVVKPWADVSIGGKYHGQYPFPPISLLEGVYWVDLKNPEINREERRQVIIFSGKETKIDLDWR